MGLLEDTPPEVWPKGIVRRIERRIQPGGVQRIIDEFGLPSGQQSDNSKSSEGDYQEYASRTTIGSRNEAIIAIYGAVTPYTTYRYWWVDSIAKQTIALLDKSGLRKKGTIPPDPSKVVPALPKEELTNMLAMFGIGTEVESDEAKAERIRTEIQNKKKDHGN